MHQVAAPERLASALAELTRDIRAQEGTIRQGGGEAGRLRQEKLGRLTARQRVAQLLDAGAPNLSWGFGPRGGCIPSGVTCRPPACWP